MIRFKASPTAYEALQFDAGHLPGLRRVTGDTFEAPLETARQIMGDARAYANGSGGWSPECWRYVRPCRAVAQRIATAIAKAAKGGAA